MKKNTNKYIISILTIKGVLKIDDVNISILIKVISNSFDKHLTSNVTDIELTSSQCKIVCYLHRNKDREINPIDIEKNFKLKKPTVTGLLQRLEEKEFIDLKPSCKDKRYKQIVLTEKSKQYHQLMRKKVEVMENTMYKGLSDGEKEDLKRLLNIIVKNLNG